MFFPSDDCISGVVIDEIGLSRNIPNDTSSLLLSLTPQTNVDTIFCQVGNHYNWDPEDLKLSIRNNVMSEVDNDLQLNDSKKKIIENCKFMNDNDIQLNDYKKKTLEELGINFKYKHTVIVSGLIKNKPPPYVPKLPSDDDLLLGASASPTATETSSNLFNPSTALTTVDINCPAKNTRSKLASRPSLDTCNYVGLVNQAMTCYLNSLLQALFMTPEFRNALYNWEFDGQQTESKSIPFQLQKLFLNLQTSTKSAVETTDLTISFGWGTQAAWEQHDIQELCRVMFDALEQKFKDTKQANLINDLYEGKMLDYVKCLECSTEKSREDTFLDIPLPVRPFGSNVAYNSVEEALRAFVQPEILDENNQYHCEKCNKKCDAHKGLKFIKFPYLLTLHLKRFDFDYTTMHRIKLNDKVVFPEILNLNSFIPNVDNLNETENMEERETIVKCDDCSTTDSGSALDDESCQGTDVSSTVNGQDDTQDDDEGIDVSSGNNHENEKNRLFEPKGPYLYELFSIMIHSGSASGGHYYAYIKEFEKNQWFCFNDQSVTRITEDDIRKTYGGGPQRGYYSGAYTSSTNAYMLMYRQIDKNRNAVSMGIENFPPHIKKLLIQMREKEENDRIAKEKENDMFKLKIFCHNPIKKQLEDTKLIVFIDSYLSEAASDAHEKFKLKEFVNLKDCRLVSYNKAQDIIDCSFESDNLRFCDISSKINVYNNDWLLEIKSPGTEFQVYKPGGVNMKVFVINLETEEVDGPMVIRVNAGETVKEFKLRLANMLHMDANIIKVVQETYSNEPHLLEEDDVPMKFDSNCSGYKIYVSNSLDEDPEKPFIISKLHAVIDRFVHIITIDVVLPDVDIGTLDYLSIPPLDLNQNIDKIELGSGERSTSSPSLRVSPQSGCGMSSEPFGDQSNSEDSSLSDSDRTLVGDAPGDCLGLLSSSSNSPADQHMASPCDPTEDTYNLEVFTNNQQEDMNWDEVTPEPEVSHRRCGFHYFKATPCHANGEYADVEAVRSCRVLVDKRMNLAKFKKNLEPFVGVSVEYFKIYRQYPNQDVEWSTLTDRLSSSKDGERLIVKLGRVLKKDEFSGKIYYLTPDHIETFKLLFEWIIGKGETVGIAKRDILLQAKKQHMLDIPYNKCRLRKKNWKNPGKVYLDDMKFVDDIDINNNFEIFLQELPDSEKVTSGSQLVLFVKKWIPSSLTVGTFSEVVLDNNNLTTHELKRKISEQSNIPLEYVDIAYLKHTFPCDMNVLEINDLDWNPDVTNLEDSPLQIYDDGSAFMYRDSREQLKDLSYEEKKELHHKENSRLGKMSSKPFLPRRECALKIYLDTSPNKSEDTCVD